MKKKKLNTKLALGKRVISNLETETVQGGTDLTIIIETIKTTIQLVTRPNKTEHDACTIIATCYCSMTCPKECCGQ